MRAGRQARSGSGGGRHAQPPTLPGCAGFWKIRFSSRNRSHDLAEAVEHPLVTFLLVQKVCAVPADGLFFVGGQVEAGQDDDGQVDETVVETHQFEHVDARTVSLRLVVRSVCRGSTPPAGTVTALRSVVAFANQWHFGMW